MHQVNIHEAKTYLSQLVEDVAHGDEIIIAKAGKPVARLASLETSRRPCRRGLLEVKIQAYKLIFCVFTRSLCYILCNFEARNLAK
jgi:prevent-host-death family protein